MSVALDLARMRQPSTDGSVKGEYLQSLRGDQDITQENYQRRLVPILTLRSTVPLTSDQLGTRDVAVRVGQHVDQHPSLWRPAQATGAQAFPDVRPVRPARRTV